MTNYSNAPYGQLFSCQTFVHNPEAPGLNSLLTQVRHPPGL